MNKIHPSR